MFYTSLGARITLFVFGYFEMQNLILYGSIFGI